jgi:hypothetical protein
VPVTGIASYIAYNDLLVVKNELEITGRNLPRRNLRSNPDVCSERPRKPAVTLGQDSRSVSLPVFEPESSRVQVRSVTASANPPICDWKGCMGKWSWRKLIHCPCIYLIATKYLRVVSFRAEI